MIDVGVDVQGARRNTKRQTKRLTDARARAGRIRAIIKKDGRAARVIKPSVHAVLAYGAEAIWGQQGRPQ